MAQTSNKPATAKREHQAKLDRRECLNHGGIVDLAEAYRRGLCAACYQSAHRAVQMKLVTWAELVERGIAAPAEKGGRPRKRPNNTPLDKIIEQAYNKAAARKKPAKSADPKP